MTSDPIADMLTRVRNAMAARHPKVDVPASKLKAEIARILKEEGYIANFKVAPAEAGHKGTEDDGVRKVIRIYLKYATDNSPVVTGIERVSRPGCRTYVGKTDIPRVQGGLGISILTTPRGVMTGRTARKEGVGGEILCRVW
jgi:small subunit ribosomal protein S8